MGMTQKEREELARLETAMEVDGLRDPERADLIDSLRAKRRPFPMTADPGDSCPACGKRETLRLVETVSRMWNVESVTDDGAPYLFAYDDSVGEDGDDTHVLCIGCETTWDPPEGIQYG